MWDARVWLTAAASLLGGCQPSASPTAGKAQAPVQQSIAAERSASAPQTAPHQPPARAGAARAGAGQAAAGRKLSAACVAQRAQSLAGPLSASLGAARAWLLGHFNPEVEATDKLALALVGFQASLDPATVSSGHAQLVCAAEQLSVWLGEKPALGELTTYGQDLEFLSDEWLRGSGLLFHTGRFEPVLSFPVRASTAIEAAPAWELSADGPIQRLPDGTQRLYRHLSDVEGGGGFTVGAWVSPDQAQVATLGRGDTARGELPMVVRLWDAANGQQLWQRALPTVDMILHAAWSPDGKHLAVAGLHMQPEMKPDHGSLYLLEARTGRIVWRVASEEPQRYSPGGSAVPLSDVVWFKDSQRLIVAHTSSARILSAVSGRKGPRLSYGEEPNYVRLQLAPSESWLVAEQQLGGGGSILLSLDGRERIHLGPQSAAKFSPSGRYLIAADPESARLIDLQAALAEQNFGSQRSCNIGAYALPAQACAGSGD